MSRQSSVFDFAAPRRAAVACLAGTLLAACGGGYGGGGGGTPNPPPTTTISVSPTTIVLGQSATLTWHSDAGSSCTASGGWSGDEPASGNMVVTPAAAGTVTYTLACDVGGPYGGQTTTVSATLTVNAQSAFSTTSLVTDPASTGGLGTDASLVNPWGIAFGPATFAWVANNHTETSTLYDGNGKPQPNAAPLTVSFASSASGTTFDPTGVVYNGTNDFVVTSGANSGPARFIFAGEGGMIAGWSFGADPAHAITTYTDAGGAVYKGIALANNGTANFVYATDFHNNKIDVFDASFTKQTPTATSFAFTDPTLPAGYAPFGIQAIANGTGGAVQIYVTYAMQAPPDNHDNANGAGLGLVDIYDANGNLVKHLVAPGGALNAPWGLALAPADFGTLSGTLLVGNFGDGKINGYDAGSGTFAGSVADSTGAVFAVPGLWGIAFGNDSNNQPHNTLFYAAGTNDEANGVFGRIDLGATPPALNQPPVVTITAPSGTVSGTVAVTATAQDSVAIAKVEFFDNDVSLGSVTTSPYTLQWNTTQVSDGAVTLKATATDVDGNVGSTTVDVTVSNNTAATTLTEIQSLVFTPICSGCHNGSNPPGGALPGSQNLTSAANSYAALVNVASLEQPAIKRVKPGDPANSYLIQKLQGAPGISGSRMPLGGTPLDQATMDKITSWITSGAPNN